MYLKSLTLKGFKSFADRTHMVFDPGLNVVVGPNGSGKSNVSDSILWVLGEQSAKMLRGQAMEDVVFSGSSARKPVGLAEVTLVLDNSDGTIPVDFREVGVTRRMYRSGESEYLINGSPARLMDIQDILHDSGLGKDTHSIISQGKLDAVLSSRPEERRALIEEAAGISKHRRRKERSQRKLQEMDKSLVRAKDVAREVNRQLRPLERQVGKAQRYNELAGRLSELACQLAVDDLRQLQAAHAELELRGREAQAAIELAQRRSDERAAELERLQSTLEQKGLYVGDLGEQRRRAADVASRLDADARLLEERGRNLMRRLAEAREDADRLTRQRTDALAERTDVSERLVETRAAHESLRRSVEELAPAAEHAVAARKRAGALAGRLSAEQRDCQRDLDRATLEVVKLKDMLSNAESEQALFASRLDQLDEEAAGAREALEERVARLEELDERLEDAEAAGQSARAAIEARSVELERARSAQDSARRALEEARAEATRARTTLSALESVDVSSHGDSKTLEARVLADASLAALVRSRLSDLVDAPEELDSLVERLFADALAAPVVVDAADALRLAEAALRSDGSGRLTVLSLATVAPEAPSDAPGFSLASRLTVTPEARSLIDSLAGGIRVVEDAREALSAHEAFPSLTFVTADGVCALPDGRLTVGGSGEEASGTLERKRRMRALSDELPGLEEAVEAARVRLEDAASAADDALAGLARAREEQAQAAGDLSRVRGERDSLNSERGRLEAQLRRSLDEFAKVERQRDEAASRTSDARPRLDELAASAEAARERLEELTEELEEASDARAQAAEAESEATRKASEARLDLATSTERLRHLEGSERDLARRLEDLTRRHEAALTASRELAVMSRRVAPLQERYDSLREVARAWEARLADKASIAEADSASLRSTIAEARRAVTESASALEGAREEASDVKVRLGQLEVRVEQAIRDIEATGAVLDDALTMPAPEDRTCVEREVEDLRRAIDKLGPVNQVAMDEYTRLKERADYISEQLGDLESARGALAKITSAIERKMRRQFLETFEAVNENFIEIFSVLFPGGRGHIEMTDPDHPDATGIEVVAQPRGKRIAKMTLMSGGEKSLIALALLFAVYKTRTVPFYVFDEVEAALDDSNLDKLLDAIDALKETTQLIVISHQRRTMEQADVLYGVSMHADGVSHVISQRLDRMTGKVVDA